MINIKTDNGKFRAALLLAGFFERAECQIYNDKSKGFRRLKLWFADSVFNAPREQQEALEKFLRELFGDRVLSMYFIDGGHWRGPDKSLCIRLRD